MASAVLEEEKVSYKAPMPEVTTRVRWYANGDRNNKPQPAYVLDVFPQTNMVRLYVVSDQLAPIKTPLYFDDPRVTEQPNCVKIESRGTWDFSEEHYRREAFEQEIRDKLTKLEERIIDTIRRISKP